MRPTHCHNHINRHSHPLRHRLLGSRYGPCWPIVGCSEYSVIESVVILVTFMLAVLFMYYAMQTLLLNDGRDLVRGTWVWVNIWAFWHSSKLGANAAMTCSSVPIIWTISWSLSTPMALWTTKRFIENKVLIQGHRRNTQYTLVYLKQRDELCIKTFEHVGLCSAVKVNMVP